MSLWTHSGGLGPVRLGQVELYVGWSAPLALFGAALWAPGAALGLAAVWLVHTLGHVWALRGLGVRFDAVHVSALGGECRWRETVGHSRLAVIAWSGVGAQGVLLLVWAAARLLFGGTGGPWLAGLDAALLYGNAALIVLNLLPLPGLDGDLAWSLLDSDPRVREARRPRTVVDPEEERRREETERIFQKMLDGLMPSSTVDRSDDED